MPYKAILLGSSGVGKTSLFQVMLQGRPDEEKPITKVTINCSRHLIKRTYKHPLTGCPRNYKLYIWDTAGQERYDSLVKNYTRSVDVVLLCIDLSASVQISQNQIRRFLELLRSADTMASAVFLVGCKSDLVNHPRLKLYKIANHFNHGCFTRTITTSIMPKYQTTALYLLDMVLREAIMTDPDDDLRRNSPGLPSMNFDQDDNEELNAENAEFSCCVII